MHTCTFTAWELLILFQSLGKYDRNFDPDFNDNYQMATTGIDHHSSYTHNYTISVSHILGYYITSDESEWALRIYTLSLSLQ